MTCAIHTDQVATAYCRTCGKALCQSCQRDVRGVIYCQDCLAARLEGTIPAAAANAPAAVYVAPSNSASPGLAAVLGVIPGVGAFYNGQFAKGFVHVFIFAILVHLSGAAGDFFGWLIPAWICYMIFDAYVTAKARMLAQPLPDHLGLNALLSGFGLGGPAPAHAPAASAPVNPVGVASAPAAPESNFAAVEGGATAVPNSAYPDSGPLQRSCGPGGMPLGAVILIALGVLLLLDNLGVLSFRWTAEFWPIVLIVLGIWLALRRMGMTQGRS